MARLLIVTLLIILWGCSAQKKADPLAGSYVSWSFIDGQAFAYDGSLGTSDKLTLRPNGTYSEQIDSQVMGLISIRADGTYKRVGDQVSLKGTMVSSAFDGYKKSTTRSPHDVTFKLEDGMLMAEDVTGDPTYFRKEGTGTPPLPPQLRLKTSDLAAMTLLKDIEKTYAELKSLRVTGTVKSQGGGFVAKDARFKVLYQSPSKFRFETVIFDGQGIYDRTEITWDGGPKCWWYTKEFGESTDRTLSNALGIASVDCGPQADILPSLLFPKEMSSEGLIAEYPEVTILPDEKINGKDCFVLQLKSKGAYTTKFWIDKSTNMILRLYEDLRDVTVDFDPEPNAAIDAKEFRLGKRS